MNDNNNPSRRSSKTQINLREMTNDEKLNFLKLILNSDVKQIRKLPISTINLNFLFPASFIGIKFDKEITPLILCCYVGKLEIFNYLLTNDEIDINMVSRPENYSPLMISCYKGYYEIVRDLLERRANINQKNKNGQEPIIFCFSRLEQKSFKYENKKICFMLVELLLSYGANINSKFDKFKESSILMKLISCEISTDEKCLTTCDVIKFLIERGANINYKNKEKKTVFTILKNNMKIKPKYKQEIYTTLRNTKKINFFKEETEKSPYDNLITIYSNKHIRYKSSNYNLDIINTQNNLKELKNNLFKKGEVVFQTIDDNSSSCCTIF